MIRGIADVEIPVRGGKKPLIAAQERKIRRASVPAVTRDSRPGERLDYISRVYGACQ
jgi:hypothetical protein